MKKTNAMRLLDSKKIPYEIISYDTEDGFIDGESVAKKTDKSLDEVYKTLVGQGKNSIYVFIIPVSSELDLKKAAKITDEKKIELIHVNDILKLTGYIRGGCSPIGMKKLYPSFIQKDSLDLEKIIVSAGKIGLQIQLNPKDLGKIISGEFADITQ